MKKNFCLRAAGALLMACLLTLGAVSVSLAQFRAEADAGQQYARVAAFRVLVNGTPIISGGPGSMNINLFSTVANWLTPQGTQDPSVKQGLMGSIIAPGTGGEFRVEVKNLSEVPIDYSLTFGSLDSIDPRIYIEFDIGDGYGFQPVTGTSAVSIPPLAETNLGPNQTSSTASNIVKWRWKFQDTAAINTDDTDLGIAASPAQIVVPMSFVATQVD